MATLVYATNVSLDGYIEDAEGAFDWAPPDDEVFAAATVLMRSVDTFLYGRRLYEVMAVWETDPVLAGHSAAHAEFASAWTEGDKIVYSTTLAEPSTASTRIERHFDAEAVRGLKERASGVIAIGGANIAAQAFEAGLVDECHLFVWPMLLGGGRPGLPPGIRADLELLAERRFGNGVLLLRYRVSG